MTIHWGRMAVLIAVTAALGYGLSLLVQWALESVGVPFPMRALLSILACCVFWWFMGHIWPATVVRR